MAALEGAFAHWEQAVRASDKDRWLAALFAPDAARRDLMALYAFNLEVASVRERISEPLPGEVRLQWWRDALTGEARGDAQAHPVAAALTDVIARRRLPVAPFTNLIEARIFDLYDDLMPTVGDLEGYCGETSSALMQLAALVLDEEERAAEAIGQPELAGHAGIAYAVTGLLRAFPLHARRGQVFIPADLMAAHGVTREAIVAGEATAGLRACLGALRDLAVRHLTTAQGEVRRTSPSLAAAFLPLEAARVSLGRMDRLLVAPFEGLPPVAQWRRQWAMWRGARQFGRDRRDPA